MTSLRPVRLKATSSTLVDSEPRARQPISPPVSLEACLETSVATTPKELLRLPNSSRSMRCLACCASSSEATWMRRIETKSVCPGALAVLVRRELEAQQLVAVVFGEPVPAYALG